jgi:hypothetical protein
MLLSRMEIILYFLCLCEKHSMNAIHASASLLNIRWYQVIISTFQPGIVCFMEKVVVDLKNFQRN